MIMCPEGYEAFTLQGADVWHSKRLYDEIRRQQGPEGQRGRRLTSVVLVPVGRRTRYGFTRLVADHPDPHPPKNPGPYTKTA